MDTENRTDIRFCIAWEILLCYNSIYINRA